MSSKLHFLIESFTAEHWIAIAPDQGIIQGAKPGWIEAALFFSEQALFTLTPGLPEDLSETYRQHTLIKNVIDTPWCGWINLEELYLPLWPQETLWLWGWAPNQLAPLFQDGNLFEPIELLAKSQIYPRGLSPHPIRPVGKNPAYDWIKVSWKVAISTLARPIWEGFKVYASNQTPEDLRVITGLG